jgi:hypothetical protein
MMQYTDCDQHHIEGALFALNSVQMPLAVGELSLRHFVRILDELAQSVQSALHYATVPYAATILSDYRWRRTFKWARIAT